jgi:hypothetical protein
MQWDRGEGRRRWGWWTWRSPGRRRIEINKESPQPHPGHAPNTDKEEQGGIPPCIALPARGGGAFGNNAGVVVEQLLFPVVIIFRRTACSPNSRGWGSLGLSLKGSLFGILPFWMDDK